MWILHFACGYVFLVCSLLEEKNKVTIDLDQYSAEPGSEDEDAGSDEIFSSKQMLNDEADDEDSENEIFMVIWVLRR